MTSEALYLYPRLGHQAAVRLMEERMPLPADELMRLGALEHPDAAPAASGGHAVSPTRLKAVQEGIRDVAQKAGYPKALRRLAGQTFDRPVGSLLFESMGIVPGDAANDGVWSFLTLVVVPEIGPWRFPDKAPDRILGRPRNVLRRSFWRAWAFGTDLDYAPDGCTPLGEDEFVQIMERPSLGGNRHTSQALLTAIWKAERGGLAVARSEFVRELTRRTRAVRSHLSLDVLDASELAELLDRISQESNAALGGDPLRLGLDPTCRDTRGCQLTTAWLAMAVAGRTQHGGNDGYQDSPAERYLWDSTVPNHGAVSAGDRIVLWDKNSLTGASVIEAIETWTREKVLRKCPQCGKAGIKSRLHLDPVYKCYKCQHVFDDPLENVVQVVTYASVHGRDWVDLDGALSGADLRSLCFNPSSQLSIRSLRWSDFLEALGDRGYRGEAGFLEDAGSVELNGHRTARVRVRLGQGRFRRQLLDQFGFTCALTGPAPQSALQACHLYSYAQMGEHHEDGGLLLRNDIHSLFDLGLILVNPYTELIAVSPALAEFDLYWRMDAMRLQVELSPQHRAWLELHWNMHRRNWNG